MEDFKEIDWDLVYGLLEVSCGFSQNAMTRSRSRREGKKNPLWGFVRKDQTTMEESDSDNLSLLAEVSGGFPQTTMTRLERKKNPLWGSKEEKPSFWNWVGKENGLKMVNTGSHSRFSGDLLPKSDVGIIVAMADRLNTLVGLFAAGCQPNSTNGPFGLRRISYGLLSASVCYTEIGAISSGLWFISCCVEFNCQCNWENLMQIGCCWMQVDEGISPEVVDDAAFETNEEKALWESFLSVKNKVHPGIFSNIISLLVLLS
ncbi:Glycine-tRNA ligase, beta subunit [Corchorus olitorius]|uniref:glycine--tRNA ligase n=1 Tax=Corchorus olitorius TaxID=93759 RepID=A0A1R3GE24_9ROSI|nr:Glycine-tRNA ligase, beta subunit [Corchorus olitorius]